MSQSQFFEKNKKKGSLALLLLFLKKGKGIVPMAAMAVLLAFVFILPSGYNHGFPMLAKFADALGLGNLFGRAEPTELTTFNEALSNARKTRNREELAGLMPAMPTPESGLYSRLGLVKKEPLTPKEEPEPKAGGKSVNGVLRPEDAKKLPEGVALKEEELHNGLLNNNAAAGAVSGPAVFANKMGLNNSFANGSRSNASFGGRADDKQLNMMRGALSGGTPPVGGASPQGGAAGKLSGLKPTRPMTSISGGGSDPARSGANSVFFQLAQGRAYSVAAAPSSTTGGLCNPPSCPNEYASNASGTVFDGKGQPTGGILGAPALGETSAPVTPDGGSVNALADQANQLQQDQQKCQQAQAMSQVCSCSQANMDNFTCTPAQTDGSQCWEYKMQADANKLNGLNCNTGGCGGNAQKCKDTGDIMKSDCRNANNAFQREAQACPLSGGQANQHDCNAYY